MTTERDKVWGHKISGFVQIGKQPLGKNGQPDPNYIILSENVPISLTGNNAGKPLKTQVDWIEYTGYLTRLANRPNIELDPGKSVFDPTTGKIVASSPGNSAGLVGVSTNVVPARQWFDEQTQTSGNTPSYQQFVDASGNVLTPDQVTALRLAQAAAGRAPGPDPGILQEEQRSNQAREQAVREAATATVEAARVVAAAQVERDRLLSQETAKRDDQAVRESVAKIADLKRAAAFEANKDAYARSVDNVKLSREAQTAMFTQQSEIAKLQTEQVGLIARRDESQAQLDQAVNLANMSAEQRGQEFNVTQEFNVQRANEEAARARQQQLQTLGTDIGKLGADSGDRGQYAATILANSGWGQADRALAGTNMNTTASLSPLESLLRQRETVQNISDKPYTYKATTIPTAARTQVAPVDFSRVTIPTPQPLAAFTPAPAFDLKSVTDTTSSAGAPAGYNPFAGGPNNVATKEQTAAIAANPSGANPFAGLAQMALKQGQTLGQVNAYGTKGTKEREFITGDPQRNGKPNPELVRVNNPGPNTRVEVIPLQGNGDMNMTSMYAEGTDTGLMAPDGRKRGPLEVLQMLMKNGVDPQKALDMVKALGFDAETGGWKPENKAPEPEAEPEAEAEAEAEPMPTGPQNLFTEKATEGNVRAGIPASRGIVESVKDTIKENPKTSVAVGVGAGALLGAAAKALLGKRAGGAVKAAAKPVAKAAAGAAAAAPSAGGRVVGGRALADLSEDEIATMLARGQYAAKALNVGGRVLDDLTEDEIADMLARGQYAYGTPDAGGMPAGGDVQTIINALRSNPQALDAFMTMIGASAAPAAGGAGAGMPSFPA